MTEDGEACRTEGPPDAFSTEVVRKRDKDVLFGLCLMAASGVLVVYATRISHQAMSSLKVAFYVAPGFPILVVAGCLGVLSAALVAIAVKQGGTLRWVMPGALLRGMRTKVFRQNVAIFVYLFLYMCLLWERVPVVNVRAPFGVTTFLFLCAMMITFRAARLRSILLISGVTTVAIVVAFQYLAGIPLP